ncbi:hypothetical protein D3C79_882720 [compost metagenome]
MAAFHERAEQAYRAVLADFQECRYLGAAFLGGGRRRLDPADAQRQAKAQDQGAYGGTGEKTPTRQVDGFARRQVEQYCGGIDRCVHQAFSPWASSCTAAWMAL